MRDDDRRTSVKHNRTCVWYLQGMPEVREIKTDGAIFGGSKVFAMAVAEEKTAYCYF